MNNMYGAPMPSGTGMGPSAMPSGTPMYGLGTSPMSAVGGSAPTPPMAPAAPAAHSPTYMAGQAIQNGLAGAGNFAANPGAMMGQLAARAVGNNGFGVHPDVTHDQIADYLLPKFRQVESSGDYTNYIGKSKKQPFDLAHTASGGYGYTNGTWNNYGGYPRAMDAPAEVQDRRMREDLTHSLQRFQGDPFKVVAHHYYPKYASDPTKWDTPITDKYGKPIAGAQTVRQYIESVLPPDRVGKYLAAAAPAPAAQLSSSGAM